MLLFFFVGKGAEAVGSSISGMVVGISKSKLKAEKIINNTWYVISYHNYHTMYYQGNGKFLRAIFLKGNLVSTFYSRVSFMLSHQSPVEGYKINVRSGRDVYLT